MGFYKKIFDAADIIMKSIYDDRKDTRKGMSAPKTNFVPEQKRKTLPKVEPVVKSTKKKETISKVEPVVKNKDNEGLFYKRLETMIADAMENIALTDREQELLNRLKQIIDADKMASAYYQNTQESAGLIVYVNGQSDVIDANCEDAYLIKNREEASCIFFPSGIKRLGDMAFSDCESLGEIDLSKCSLLGRIGKQAFEKCVNLKSLKLPTSLKEIGPSAFEFTSIKGLVLPDKIENIGDFSFFQCEDLEEVDFSKCTQLEKIGESVFERCVNLKRLKLPNSLKEIGSSAFKSTSIKELVLPDKIENIGYQSFCICEDLEEVDFSKCTQLATIEDMAFFGCKKLKKIDLSKCSQLATIGGNAFRGCILLESIIIPDGLEIIPDHFFENTSLKNIVLPSSIKRIGAFAFENCEQLENIVIPEGLDIIPNKCFNGCTNLKNIVLPSSIKTIQDSAFLNCGSLKSLTISIGCRKIEIFGHSYIPNNDNLNIFLPPTLSSIRFTKSTGLITVYCFSPNLDELESLSELADNLYVLPQYIENYRAQAEAEQLTDELEIIPIPDEYLYYYDN